MESGRVHAVDSLRAASLAPVDDTGGNLRPFSRESGHEGLFSGGSQTPVRIIQRPADTHQPNAWGPAGVRGRPATHGRASLHGPSGLAAQAVAKICRIAWAVHGDPSGGVTPWG